MSVRRLKRVLGWMHWLRPYDWAIPLLCKLLPQLRELPVKQQRRIARAFDGRMMRAPAAVLLVMGGNLFLFFGILKLHSSLQLRGFEVGLASLTVLAILFFVVFLASLTLGRYVLVLWVLPGRLLQVLRRLAREMSSVRVCERCGYDLRGTSGGRCSECGAPAASETENLPSSRVRFDTLVERARRHDDVVRQIDALNVLLQSQNRAEADAVVEEVYHSAEAQPDVKLYIARSWVLHRREFDASVACGVVHGKLADPQTSLAEQCTLVADLLHMGDTAETWRLTDALDNEKSRSTALRLLPSAFPEGPVIEPVSMGDATHDTALAADLWKDYLRTSASLQPSVPAGATANLP